MILRIRDNLRSRTDQYAGLPIVYSDEISDNVLICAKEDVGASCAQRRANMAFSISEQKMAGAIWECLLKQGATAI